MDSTFNLIQRLLTTTVPVQPHYIVRHEDSTGIEIDTMMLRGIANISFICPN